MPAGIAIASEVLRTPVHKGNEEAPGRFKKKKQTDAVIVAIVSIPISVPTIANTNSDYDSDSHSN